MKKLLALVLALVMTLGLATVGANAAYKDADSINYKEAVDVMSAIGVLAGDETGFRPADTLKRSEGAKIVAYLMLGNKTAEAIQASGTKYTDLPANHWAAGYMEYLTSAGVMGGVGDGKIDPDGQLTATAFAKMLLTALGYDAKIEGLVGSDWSINTQKLANDNDLFDGLDILGSAALTREQAAQMCLNDLKADVVEYDDKGTTVNVGGATVVTGAKKATAKTTTNNKGNAINDDDAAGTAANPYTLQLGEDLYNGDLKLTSDGNDDMGRPANKWTYKNTDVGTFAASSDVIYSTTKAVTKKALYDVIGKDAFNNLRDGKGNELEVYVDGKEVTTPVLGDYIDKDSSADSGESGRAVLTEVFKTEDIDSNNNDRYTIVFSKTYLVQATADYSSSAESVKVKYVDDSQVARPSGMPTEIKQEDFNVKDVKEDDYLVVTYSIDAKEFQTVKPATMVTGKVSSYVFESSVTVDGTKYQYAKVVAKTATMGKSITFDIDSTVVLVTDGEYILAVDDKDVNNNFVYIQAAGATSLKTKVEAKAYFTDGTSKTISVKKATYFETNAGTTTWAWSNSQTTTDALVMDGTDGGANGTTRSIAGQWYTYTTDDNGEYTLKALSKADGVSDYTQKWVNNYATGNTVLLKDTVTFLNYGANTNSTYKGNNETVVYVLDNDDELNMYTGIENMPAVTLGTVSVANSVKASFAYDTDGYVKYVFVDASKVASTIDDSTESDDYLFLLKRGDDHTDDKNENTYTDWDAIKDGEKVSVKIDSSAAFGQQAGVLYNKIKTNSKGYITSAKVVGSANSNKMYSAANGTGGAQLTGADAATITAKTITYSGSTLSIGGKNYVVNSGASLNLVYMGQKLINSEKASGNKYNGKDMTALVDDVNANYNIDNLNTSGSGIASELKNLAGYEYDYFVVGSDTLTGGEGKIDVLYIWVYDATAAAEAAKVKFAAPTGTVLTAIDALTADGLITLYDASDDSKVQDSQTADTKSAKDGWEYTVAPGTYYYTITDTNAVTYKSAEFTLTDGDIETVTIPQFYAVTPVAAGNYEISAAEDGTFAATALYAVKGSTIYAKGATGYRVNTTGTLSLTATDTDYVYSFTSSDTNLVAGNINTTATYVLSIDTTSACTAMVKVNDGDEQVLTGGTPITVDVATGDITTIEFTAASGTAGTVTKTSGTNAVITKNATVWKVTGITDATTVTLAQT